MGFLLLFFSSKTKRAILIFSQLDSAFLWKHPGGSYNELLHIQQIMVEKIVVYSVGGTASPVDVAKTGSWLLQITTSSISLRVTNQRKRRK